MKEFILEKPKVQKKTNWDKADAEGVNVLCKKCNVINLSLCVATGEEKWILLHKALKEFVDMENVSLPKNVCGNLEIHFIFFPQYFLPFLVQTIQIMRNW